MYSIDWTAIRTGVSLPFARPGALRAARVSPVVWSLGFTSLLTDVSSEMVSSILPVYLLLHLHVSPAAFGVIDGLYQGFAILVRVAAGNLGDRLRRHKAVALAGYAVSALCRLGMLAAGASWTGIAAVTAADRAGKGVRTAPRDALISMSTASAHLARAFGVHRALDAAGALLGPLAAFAILAWLPDAYDVLFVASFGVALLGAGVLAIFVSEPAVASAGSAASVESSRPGVATLLRDARLRGVTFAAAALGLGTVSDSFVFLALQQQGGFAAGMFPLLFVAVALVNCAGSAPIGRLADHVGRTRIFLAGHSCLLIVYAVLLSTPGGAPATAVCLLLVGLYYAATDGVLAALTSSMLPHETRGTGLAIVASAVNAGRLASSLAFGAIWAARGLHDAMLFSMIVLLIAVIAAASVLFRRS